MVTKPDIGQEDWGDDLNAALDELQAGTDTHAAAADPHEDRAYTDTELAGHVADIDPHGDRAYTDGEVATHAADTDPHGDRAYAAATFLPLVGDVVGRPRVVRKTADESVTSSTTLQDDDHLTLSVVANGVYAFDGCMLFDCADANTELKLTFTVPAGSSGWWAPGGITNSSADGSGGIRLSKFDLGVDSSSGAVSSGALVIPHGYIAVGGTAGSFTFQWAQLFSNASPVFVRTGSWLRLHRIA